MKTQYYTASSLDGFIATKDDGLDWLLSLGDIAETSYPEFIRDVGVMCMGSATYEWLLRHEPGKWPYDMPTWVFTSRRLPQIDGADVRFRAGDVRPVHDAMREAAAGRNVWIVGGGDLAGQFYDAGLLDEFIVQYAPVALGDGKPLLPRRIPGDRLELRSTHRYGPFVEVRYAVRRA